MAKRRKAATKRARAARRSRKSESELVNGFWAAVIIAAIAIVAIATSLTSQSKKAAFVEPPVIVASV